MTPRVSPRLARRPPTSLEEYRAAAADGDGWVRADDSESLFWRYVMGSPHVDPRKLFDEPEWRVLNKTTTTAGGFLVPQDLESQVVAAARAESAVAQVALELRTESGETLLLPTPRTALAPGRPSRPGTRPPTRCSRRPRCRRSRARHS